MIQIASLPKKLEHNRLLFISYITHTQRNLQIHNLPTKLETQQWNLRLAFYNLETQTLLLKPQNTMFYRGVKWDTRYNAEGCIYCCLLFIPPTTLLRGDMRLAQYITW